MAVESKWTGSLDKELHCRSKNKAGDKNKERQKEKLTNQIKTKFCNKVASEYAEWLVTFGNPLPNDL